MSQASVFRCAAAYYIQNQKRWLYGLLIVTQNGIHFSPTNQESSDNYMMLHILFENITHVKRATSSFIFKAVTVSCKNVQHWIGSLPNRDGVFNVIEHFWRERLIPSKPKNVKGKTRLGQEILRVAHDSDKTLTEASKVLHQQGVQLEHALGVTLDIHQDLDVAENLTHSLESWFGSWGLSRNLIGDVDPMELVDTKGIPIIHHFPILYTYGDYDVRKPCYGMLNGTLRISREGLTILDVGEKPVHHYKPRDISAFRLISPWHLVISKYQIGNPDMTYAVRSSHIVKIMSILEPVYQQKFQYFENALPQFLEYESPNEYELTEVNQIAASSPCQNKTVLPRCALDTEVPRSEKLSTSDLSTLDAQQQQQISKADRTGAVTSDEVEDLTDLLGRMKCTALDVGTEQDRQIGVIDKLTEVVDHADHRIRTNNQRINKLL